MKNNLSPIVRCTLIGASALLVSLCFPLVATAASDEEAIHDELRQLKTVYENAINSGDLSKLEAVFDSGSSGVVVDNQLFKSPADLKAIYDRFHASLPGVIYRIKLNPEKSLLFGNVAVAYGTGEEYVKTDAGEFNYTTNFTAVLRRDDKQQWKLVRSQFTMDPFKNSVVQYFVSKTKLYFGGGALAVGLIGGFILGRLFAPKSKTAT